MKKFANIIIFCFFTFNFLLLTSYLYCQSGWSEDMRLTFDYAYSADPRAACWGDTIHLVWWKNYLDSLSNYRDEIFYKRSTDAGETWGDDVLLSIENDDASVQPTVGVNGNLVHVVWKEEHAGVCYRKSTDGGNAWLQIDTLPDAGLSEPWIHVDGINLYVISGAGTGFQMFTKSTDNGNTWQPGQEVMHSCGHGRITKMDTLMLVVSHQDDPYAVEIYCLRSTDDGQTWDDVQCVSQYDSISGQRPAMDTDDSSGIHITWYDYKYSPYPWTGDIFYRASRDSGNSWEEIDSLTVMHRAVASDILAEGNYLHLVWEDDRHGFNNNFEIYYRMSTDLGETWESEVRLTNASFHSRRPSLACDGDFLHLFWSDQRDSGNTGPWMLYYKRKDLVGINEEMIVKPYSVGIILNCPTILKRNSLIRYDLGSCKNGDIMIMDVTGRVLNKFPVHQVSGYFVLGSNKEVCDGIYFIMLKAEEEYITKKVLVVR